MSSEIEYIREHDKEIYNKAIDDFIKKVELEYLGVHPDELYADVVTEFKEWLEKF